MEANESSVRRPSTATRSPRKRRDELILDALERLLVNVPMSELDVEHIAAEAGITRTRFYAYFTSKHDALAALLRRLAAILMAAMEHPDSWFVHRPADVRPRDALHRTIRKAFDDWWPHRFVLREACDLWTVVPEVRATWLAAVEFSTTQLEQAIVRERKVGVAPPGCSPRRMAEALIWQAERVNFATWADLPGAMSKKQMTDVCVEAFMRTIFLADDPDPERPNRERV